MVKNKDFNWVLENGHFNSLVYDNDHNLFLIDTGVIIDLEQAYSLRGLKKHPAQLLERIALEHSLVITPRVLEEIRSHAKCKVNGKRHEISEPTLILAEILYDAESQEILRNQKFSLLDYDYNALQVYHAAIEAFKEDYKKGEKDLISCADKELLTLALLLSRGTYGILEQSIKCVNILTTDEHIPRTLHTLKTLEDFKNCKVRAIPTRHDLRSYLSK